MRGSGIKKSIGHLLLSADDQLAILASDRLRSMAPVLQDHGVENLPAEKTSPALKIQMTRIIIQVLEPFSDH